jgi:acetylornithine deacetylase/succinyl-diaminopimelate desuccinylase-like protein
VERYFQEHRDRHLAELDQFLRIPSVSALSAHKPDMERAAEWVREQLQGMGIANARVSATTGHPVVYGEWLEAPGAPTILVYGHYDVQPPDPLEKWVTPPFEPACREGRIYARGVSDDKGPLFIALKATEAYLRTEGRLPLNIKFLFEGEEEVGSPSLRPFVAEHRAMLACDLVVSADGAMWRPTEPSITVSGRGMTALEVDLQTARTDLHSGRHGGAVPNALHAMAHLIGSLHTQDGRIAVPGFYDRVWELPPAEREALAALPFDEEAYRQGLELPALYGEPGYSTLERQWIRPTIDCVGMWGGFIGEGRKTVIPCEAHAKITCRLVADQDPREILDLVAAHLEANAMPGARLHIRKLGGSSLPYEMPTDLPALKVAAAVLQEVMGQEPVWVRMGGTLPAAEVFQAELDAYMLFFSFSTADEQYHAPNEFFRLERFDAGLRAWGALYRRLGSAL